MRCGASKYLPAPLVGVLAATAIGPAGASASTTIGSRLENAPNAVLCGHPLGTLTCTDSAASLAAGNTAAGGLVAPSSGVIVRWRIRLNNSALVTSASGRLRTMRSNLAVNSGDLETLPLSTSGTFEFAARLQIQAGDRLGIDTTSTVTTTDGVGAVHVESGAGTMHRWVPALADGESRTPDTAFSSNYEVLVNADIEPDADGDGFGDETQDQCPTDPTTQGECSDSGSPPSPTPPDTTSPTISAASLSNRSFRVDRRGSVARVKAPRGTVLRFTLSETATVRATIARSTKGRRVRGKCKRKAKRGKRCKIHKSIGGFSFAGAAGRNEKPFSGRLRSGHLTPGEYRMSLSAVDGAGNKSARRTLSFRVVR